MSFVEQGRLWIEGVALPDQRGESIGYKIIR
jgi:hypothetical protein